jgi:hypothetical protein
MARDHFISPQAPEAAYTTVRLGAGSGAGNNVTTAEVGKFAKLVGESRYGVVVVGNDIEAVVTAVELAPQNGFSIGSVSQEGRLAVTFDGTEAAGTGAIAIGAIVNCGTPIAKDTALTVPPTVRSATTPANVVFKWRVVSLGTAGTGAVGTQGVIERI